MTTVRKKRKKGNSTNNKKTENQPDVVEKQPQGKQYKQQQEAKQKLKNKPQKVAPQQQEMERKNKPEFEKEKQTVLAKHHSRTYLPPSLKFSNAHCNMKQRELFSNKIVEEESTDRDSNVFNVPKNVCTIHIPEQILNVDVVPIIPAHNKRKRKKS